MMTHIKTPRSRDLSRVVCARKRCKKERWQKPRLLQHLASPTKRRRSLRLKRKDKGGHQYRRQEIEDTKVNESLEEIFPLVPANVHGFVPNFFCSLYLSQTSLIGRKVMLFATLMSRARMIFCCRVC